ncbi:hypothetical protein SHKM778_45110 [Streptomyces sp. KM77-8]|uniref:Uncharacterized protein n=1 Tax=Streptomyces haneummycinicus TaxID=3074435 RepID=A0AAT9HLH7_9ACTN
MSEQPVPADHVRQQLEPAAADAVRAYAARTRENADQFAAVLEEIADHGLPVVEDRTPWEELREAHLAGSPRSARPLPDGPTTAVPVTITLPVSRCSPAEADAR